jgi:hypothetical protein
MPLKLPAHHCSQCPALPSAAAPAHCCCTVAVAVAVAPTGRTGAGHSGDPRPCPGLFFSECSATGGSLGAVMCTATVLRGHCATQYCTIVRYYSSTKTVVAGGPKVLVPRRALEFRNWELGTSGLDAGHPKIDCWTLDLNLNVKDRSAVNSDSTVWFGGCHCNRRRRPRGSSVPHRSHFHLPRSGRSSTAHVPRLEGGYRKGHLV